MADPLPGKRIRKLGLVSVFAVLLVTSVYALGRGDPAARRVSRVVIFVGTLWLGITEPLKERPGVRRALGSGALAAGSLLALSFEASGTSGFRRPVAIGLVLAGLVLVRTPRESD